MTTQELHVYCIDDCDWFIAEDAETALRIAIEYQGPYENEDITVELQPPEKMMQIHDDDTGETSRKSFAEWIAISGRGFLCSENY